MFQPHQDLRVARAIARFTGSIAIVLAAGCAVSPEFRAKSAPSAISLPTNQGLVAVAITSNRDATSTFFGKWSSIRFRDVASRETFVALDTSSTASTQSLFVLPLPAGTYEVDSVNNSAQGWLTISSSAKAGEQLPHFKVEKSRLTDLGTLVYFRQHFPVNTSLYAWGLVEASSDQRWILRLLAPAVAMQLQSEPILGWEASDKLTERKRLTARLKRMTARQSGNASGPDGSYLFGESLGQIVLRDRTGEWRWIETGMIGPVRAILYDNGRLFAGGDDGILLMGDLTGKTWKELKLPVADASVIYIGKVPRRDELLVVVQASSEFLAYSAPMKEPGALSETLRLPRKLYFNPAMDDHGRVIANGQEVVLLTAGGGDSTMGVSYLNQDGRSWTTRAGDVLSSPAVVAITPKGELIRFAGIPLTGIYLSASPDFGASWKRRGDLNWGMSLAAASDSTFFAVRTESIPLFDPEKGESAIWRSDDGGMTWKKLGPTPGLGGRLFVLEGSQELAFATVNGKFYSSRDAGLTWKLEREIP